MSVDEPTESEGGPPTGGGDERGPGESVSAAVSAVVGPLDGLARRPVAEHPDVYESIHAELQRALAGLDDV